MIQSLVTRGRDAGFTLAELAIVLLIVGLLLAGLLTPITTQVEVKRTSDTQKTLEEVKEALLGYAVTNGRLPCPDTTGDGKEDRAVANGTDGCLGGNYEGNLPWDTLGVGQVDAWGNRFHYRVTNEFTRASGDTTASGCGTSGTNVNVCTLELGDSGNITVTTRGDNPATGGVEGKFSLSLAANVPAVIISFGKNGYGALSSTGSLLPAPPASHVDETTNSSNNATKVSRTRTTDQTGCSDTVEGTPFCEFDDLVTWLPTTVLFNRMVAAGKLP